jgi:hypothetical protein
MHVRNLLVDSPQSVGAKMRARRWEMFIDAFPGVAEYRVLDLGGTTEFWQRSSVRPKLVTVVNLLEPGEGDDWIDPIAGDACTYAHQNSYDLVVSNSLLEHVGGYRQRQLLAGVIREAAPRHWVQTPYRYFPIEPHWLCPGMQFMPLSARIRLSEHWPLAHSKPRSRQEAVDSVLWTELIGRTEMTELFPEARVVFERVAGIPKSLLAIRSA